MHWSPHKAPYYVIDRSEYDLRLRLSFLITKKKVIDVVIDRVNRVASLDQKKGATCQVQSSGHTHTATLQRESNPF